jgi:ribose transport system permease protein
MAAATQPEATPDFARRLTALRRLASEYPLLVLLLLLVALCIATNIASPGFLLPDNFSTTLLIAGPLGMLAAAQTVVVLTGGIDLSVTATATIAAYFMAQNAATNTPVAIIGALAIGLVVGFVNGIGVGPFGVSPLIMTLGMSGILSGFITIWAANSSNVQLVPDIVHTAGSGKWFGYIPIGVVIWAALAVVLMVVLRRTGFGRTVYAVGSNPIASQLAGVRTWQVLLAVYALCGLLSAIGGVLLAGYLSAVDTGMATPYLLQSVAAVVIGGTSILGGSGGYGGSIVGVLILTVLGSLLNLLDIAEALRQVLYGAVVLGLAWIYARTSGSD